MIGEPSKATASIREAQPSGEAPAARQMFSEPQAQHGGTLLTGQTIAHPKATQLLLDLARIIGLMPEETMPAVLAALSAMAGTAAARMLGKETAGGRSAEAVPDENLSIEEAARRLGVSKDYLYRHAKRLPFTRRIGRRVLFSARGLERWNRQRA